MHINELRTNIEGIKKGAFTRIVYRTQPSLTAFAKKNDVEVVKRTEKVVRLGVKYHNIESVKQHEAERTSPKQERDPWCHYVVEDILAKHNTKDDYYLCYANVNKGHHTKIQWFINGVPVSEETVKNSGYVIPSYFTPSNEAPAVQKLKTENIISLGGKKHEEK